MVTIKTKPSIYILLFIGIIMTYSLYTVSLKLSLCLNYFAIDMRIKTFFAKTYMDSLNSEAFTKEEKEKSINELLELIQYLKTDFIKELGLYDNSPKMNDLIDTFDDKLTDLQQFLSRHKEKFTSGDISNEILKEYNMYKNRIQKLYVSTDKFAMYNEKDKGFYHIINLFNPWSKLRYSLRDIPRSFIE